MPTRLAYIFGSVCTTVLYIHFIQQPSLPAFIPTNAHYPVQFSLKFSAWFILVTHSLESLYTFSLCRKHSTGFLVGVSYIPPIPFWVINDLHLPVTVCPVNIGLWNANLAKSKKAYSSSANRLCNEDPVVFPITTLHYSRTATPQLVQ
jgi:hypothetical protein